MNGKTMTKTPSHNQSTQASDTQALQAELSGLTEQGLTVTLMTGRGALKTPKQIDIRYKTLSRDRVGANSTASKKFRYGEASETSLGGKLRHRKPAGSLKRYGHVAYVSANQYDKIAAALTRGDRVVEICKQLDIDPMSLKVTPKKATKKAPKKKSPVYYLPSNYKVSERYDLDNGYVQYELSHPSGMGVNVGESVAVTIDTKLKKLKAKTLTAKQRANNRQLNARWKKGFVLYDATSTRSAEAYPHLEHYDSERHEWYTPAKRTA